MTAEDVLTSARRLLHDNAGTAKPRWSDATLLKYLDQGHRELLAKRRDLLLSAALTLGSITAITADSDTLIPGDEWELPLAHYVCSQALREDDADTENSQRADRFYGMFMDRVTNG